MASDQQTSIITVPIKTPMFDENGHLTRTWIIFFEKLARRRGSSTTVTEGAGAGPFSRTWDIKNTTIGNDIADNITAFGAEVNQQCTIRRMTATLRVEIGTALGLELINIWPDLSEHRIGVFVVPADTTPKQAIHWTVPDDVFENLTLPDRSVFVANIISSDNSVDPLGVCSFTLEWVGRGAGLAQLPEGIAFLGEWVEGSEYNLNVLVVYDGCLYISKHGTLEEPNEGNQPDTSPDDWELIFCGGVGADGSPGPEGDPGPAGDPGEDGEPGVGVPTGGTTGQVLAKSSGTDYATEWIDPTVASLPPGGTIGQVLTKLSSSDGDANWEFAGGGGGGMSINGTPVSDDNILTVNESWFTVNGV